MPYLNHWEPAPSNESLPVLKQQPDGQSFGLGLCGKPTVFATEGENKGKTYYHCQYCDGWIEGVPSRYREESLGPLCGRSGIAEHCIRCGHEINFSGMVS